MQSTKVILFNGPPRSGKDTASQATQIILERAKKSVYAYRFAEPLKDAVHALFGMAGIMVEHFDGLKDVKLGQMFGMSPREAYIWLSEECVKPRFGKDFFAHVAVNHLKSFGNITVVVSDCGFQEEVDVLIAHFGADNVALVHLLREDTSFQNDSRRYVEHIPERSYVINNNGTIADLSNSIEKVLEGFINGED